MELTVESAVECTTCGRVGGPIPDCAICHGNGGTQSRAFTRTEEAQGKGKDERRYGRTGDTSPRIVNLPGSFTPDQQR